MKKAQVGGLGQVQMVQNENVEFKEADVSVLMLYMPVFMLAAISV